MAVFSASCDGIVSDNRKETGTKGAISIAIDGTLRKVMDQQLKVWDSSYPDGKITAIYTDEQDAFRKLLQDSTIRLIITTRDLTDAEKKADSANRIKIAIDERMRAIFISVVPAPPFGTASVSVSTPVAARREYPLPPRHGC